MQQSLVGVDCWSQEGAEKQLLEATGCLPQEEECQRAIVRPAGDQVCSAGVPSFTR